MDTNSYKNCYVAFLDILGFKEYVKTKPFDVVQSALSYLETEAIANPYGISLKYEIDAQNAQILCISDSVIISIENSIDRAFEAIIWLCATFQFALLFETGLLMRGGVSSGNFYMEHSKRTGHPVVFGPAYNRAVELEKMARYPRINIDRDVVSEDVLSETPLLKKDCDGEFFVDYIHLKKRDLTFNMQLNSAAEQIVKQIKVASSVKEKFDWTQRYIEKSLKDKSIFCPECIAKRKIPPIPSKLYIAEEADHGQP